MNQSELQPIVCSKLKNRYWLLRHGQSEANQQGLIASSPVSAVARFGLTKVGQDQIADSLDQHRAELAGLTQILTSDFRRARETAEIAGSVLKVPIQECVQLRERGFGQWDGQSDENYKAVWSADAENPAHEQWGVESAVRVARRMSQFIRTLEESRVDQAILLVSHGDPLQILITAAHGRDLRLHRQLDLKTGELTPLCETRS